MVAGVYSMWLAVRRCLRYLDGVLLFIVAAEECSFFFSSCPEMLVVLGQLRRLAADDKGHN